MLDEDCVEAILAIMEGKSPLSPLYRYLALNNDPRLSAGTDRPQKPWLHVMYVTGLEGEGADFVPARTGDKPPHASLVNARVAGFASALNNATTDAELIAAFDECSADAIRKNCPDGDLRDLETFIRAQTTGTVPLIIGVTSGTDEAPRFGLFVFTTMGYTAPVSALLARIAAHGEVTLLE